MVKRRYLNPADLRAPVTGYTAGRMGALARQSLLEVTSKLRREAEMYDWDRKERDRERRAARADPKVVTLYGSEGELQ